MIPTNNTSEFHKALALTTARLVIREPEVLGRCRLDAEALGFEPFGSAAVAALIYSAGSGVIVHLAQRWRVPVDDLLTADVRLELGALAWAAAAQAVN